MHDNFLMLLWRDWYARNLMKHEGKQLKIEGSVHFLMNCKASLLQIHQQHQFMC